MLSSFFQFSLMGLQDPFLPWIIPPQLFDSSSSAWSLYGERLHRHQVIFPEAKVSFSADDDMI